MGVRDDAVLAGARGEGGGDNDEGHPEIREALRLVFLETMGKLDLKDEWRRSYKLGLPYRVYRNAMTDNVAGVFGCDEWERDVARQYEWAKANPGLPYPYEDQDDAEIIYDSDPKVNYQYSDDESE